MTLAEISHRTGIPLNKLRKLEKLKIDFGDIDPPEADPAAPMRLHLMRNQQLTVANMLTLIDQPDIYDGLGKYKARAIEQMQAIGKIEETLPPREATAAIPFAARGEIAEAREIAAWLRGVLPPHSVPHHWVAVRLLAPLNPAQREQNRELISLALLNVRKLPEFAGYWRSDKSSGRSAIKYFRAEKKELANLDL